MIDLSIVIPSFAGGGAERVMIRVANEMTERNLSVDLVVATSIGPLRKLVDPSVNVIDLDASRQLGAIVPLSRYFSERKPSSVLSAMPATNCIVALSLRLSQHSARHVMSERNLPAMQNHVGKVNRVLIPILTKWFYPRADLITTVSDEVRSNLLASHPKIDPSKIISVYNPAPDIDKQSLRPDHPWFDVSENIPVFTAIGRLNRQKDYPTLIKAFARVVRTTPARLVILGDGSLKAELEILAKDLHVFDQIDMTGFVNNPQSFLRYSHTYVMSSVFEGMPNSLIEALALNKRIVCTRCPGGPIEVLEDGKLGHMVPVGDIDCFASAMLESLQAPSPTNADMQRFSKKTIFDTWQAGLKVPG